MVVLSAALCGCSPRSADTTKEKGAEDSAAGQTEQALEKFDDNKFGMFIHWGLYALPAGEWKG
ncbi:MAG: alpha-L-fucosidase, partial [Bryobacteraceae bacterium]